jgi:molecular chaperone DnaK (HSP70)
MPTAYPYVCEKCCKFAAPQHSFGPSAMHVAQVVEAPDGGVLAEVQYMGQTAQFSPVQLLAMILVDEREIAVADGHPVTDCVVTVPVFYNEVRLVVWLARPASCISSVHSILLPCQQQGSQCA